jgi:hypothetical protein
LSHASRGKPSFAQTEDDEDEDDIDDDESTYDINTT